MSTIQTFLSTDAGSTIRGKFNSNCSNLNTDKAEKSGKLSQFASTSSSELAGVISDETGSGSLVFGTSPTITTPTLTNPTLTNPTLTNPTLTNPTSTTGTFTSPTITTPTIKVWDGWQSVTDSWSYASADSPTFTITVPTGAASMYGVGSRIKLTQTTVKYFIVTAVADTVLTVYGGTDYTLANAAISSIYVSNMKSPLGFPVDPAKWTVESTTSTELSQATPSSGTWYNLGSMNIVVPIGAWRLYYSCNAGMADNTATSWMYTTLSTGNNTESDTEMTALVYAYFNGTNALVVQTHFKEQLVTLAAKATYYLNGMVNIAGTDNIRHGVIISGRNSLTIIRAVCVYL